MDWCHWCRIPSQLHVENGIMAWDKLMATFKMLCTECLQVRKLSTFSVYSSDGIQVCLKLWFSLTSHGPFVSCSTPFSSTALTEWFWKVCWSYFCYRKKPAKLGEIAKPCKEDITTTQCEAYELTKLGHEYEDLSMYQNVEYETPIPEYSADEPTRKSGEWIQIHPNQCKLIFIVKFLLTRNM